jgi:hypothetical protein
MSTEIALQKTSLIKVKDELKPPEVRIEAWKNFLNKAFKFEVEALEETIDLCPEDITPIPVNPTEDELKGLLAMIKPYEDIIKTLKQDEKRIQEGRKNITSKFDDVRDRLSLPEKTIKTYYQTIEKHLIQLKKLEEIQRRKLEEQERKILAFKRDRMNAYNDEVLAFKKHILSHIKQLYNTALDTISPLDLDEFIESHQWDFNEHRCRNTFNHSFLDDNETKINREIFSKWDSEDFVGYFLSEFKIAFKNFDIDILHKEEARKESERSSKEAEKIAEDTKQLDDVEVILETSVSRPVISLSGSTKALKKVYEINMSDTDETMASIIRAFFGNFVSCMANIKRGSKFDISIGDMGKSLCALKNKDNNFQPDNIIFKQIEKL